MIHLQRAASQGAALLDRKVPWWELAINADTLKLSSGKKCVLGRLFGSFKSGCKQLGITLEEAVSLGFHAPTDMSKRETKRYYASLLLVWADCIERRMPAPV